MLSSYDRTARLQGIVHLLYQHPKGLTAKQLAERRGVSVRTVFRDLVALESQMGVLFWKEEGRWVMDKNSFVLPLRLSILEATALFLASRLAHRHGDERNRPLESAWEKLAVVLPGPVGQQVQATVTAMMRKPENAEFSRIAATLLSAWAGQRRVRIHYPDAGSGEIRERLIEPYFMEPSGMGHALYVIARDCDVPDGLRTFKVERISEITLTDDAFTIPDDFDAEAHLRSSFLIWDGPEVEVTVRFTPAVAVAVREATWHPSQRIESQLDGGLLWHAKLAGTVEVTPWIRSWGADAVVIAPAELRDRFAAESRRLAQLYR